MTDIPEVVCEKCGAPIEVFREGRTQGIRCTRCDWSVVTTYTPPIQQDRTIYEVRIRHGDHHNEHHVKAIAHVVGGNFLGARKLLQDSQPVVFSGDAQSVAKVRDTLLAATLEISIQPDFPW